MHYQYLVLYCWYMHLSTGLACPELCSCTLDVMNCTSLQLQDVPKDIPQTIEEIYLSHNALQIKTLIRSNLQPWPENTTVLDLSYNGIRLVSSTMFDGLAALIRLLLNNNEIRSLTTPGPWNFESPFLDLKNLEYLDLSCNNIESLTSKDFSGISKLRILKLDRNRLSETPRQSFLLLPNLTELSMKGAFTKKTSIILKLSAFTTLPQLETLILSKNRIHLIETENATVVFANLKALDLSVNSLSDLNCLRNVRMLNLRSLNLKKNNLSYVSKDTFVNLTSLTAIDLRHNDLEEVPYFWSDYPLEIAFSGNRWNCTCDQLKQNTDIRLVCGTISDNKIQAQTRCYDCTGGRTGQLVSPEEIHHKCMKIEPNNSALAVVIPILTVLVVIIAIVFIVLAANKITAHKIRAINAQLREEQARDINEYDMFYDRESIVQTPHHTSTREDRSASRTEHTLGNIANDGLTYNVNLVNRFEEINFHGGTPYNPYTMAVNNGSNTESPYSFAAVTPGTSYAFAKDCANEEARVKSAYYEEAIGVNSNVHVEPVYENQMRT